MGCSLSSLLAIPLFAAGPAGAITFTPAPSAHVDFSGLGRVGLAGDFSGISLYQFVEQTESPFDPNGTQSLFALLPNGVFAAVAQTDASIQAMCDFSSSTGSSAGVVVAGNFTSFNAQESQGIALFNADTSSVTPMPGLSGQVNALLCDPDTDTVYVGGNFVGVNSTNALAWSGTSGWQNLPFAGFNGPVTSITKASNGHIIFGGSFTGLGNATTPTTPDEQVINLSTANISASASATTTGFSDPKNIVCKPGGLDGADKTWLLEDQTAGSWTASFGFGFQPSKLRLYNTHQDGRGTQTWRFTALPINGIMNFTYIDPATGANMTCTSECPLSNSPTVDFQDFHFVNMVGMNEFRIDISAWYGSGAGLDGIQLFSNDIFAYAIPDFNEPACAGVGLASTSSQTGNWVVTPARSSSADYLTVVMPAPIEATAASITFSPDIRESGDYSVNLYTPGCLRDATCSTRGQFNITGSMTADGASPISTVLYQTNNFDKYDQIYFGKIDAASSGFRPRITMTPVAGQNLDSMTFVAQKVGFTLLGSTGGLIGLYEYDPSSGTVNTSDFASSAFDKLGASFTKGSAVTALATAGDVTYIAGNFSSPDATNIVSLRGGADGGRTQSLDGGLNGQVLSMVLSGTSLFAGGDFTSNRDETAQGLAHVAVYDSTKNAWGPLGAGVDGRVMRVALMSVNVTSTTPEVVVGISGDFTQLEGFGSSAAVPVNGFGIWVPSQGNWLQNLQLPVGAIEGVLSSSLLNVAGGTSLYGGSLSSSTLRANGVVTLGSSAGGDTLGKLPVDMAASPSPAVSASKRDRAASSATRGTGTTTNGVVTGLFDTNNGRNNTILAGHFTATATNGSTVDNLVILDGSNAVTGLGPAVSTTSTFSSLLVSGDTLFAGGNVTASIGGDTVNGLVSYNLASQSFNTQPPSVSGGNATVAALTLRPDTGDVYVGGSFQSAGSLGCPGVCVYSTGSSQWNQPGTNLDGTVGCMLWTSTSTLVVGGKLKVNNTASTFLATYDANRRTWDSFPGASQLPGPVDIVTAASSDASQLWVAGTAPNGSVFLMKYDGTAWAAAVVGLAAGSHLRGLQMLPLSAPHASSALMDADHALLLTGALQLPGTASAAAAATFDGTSLAPFALTTGAGNAVGSAAHVFAERGNFFGDSGDGHMPVVFVVLIGLGMSLGLMLLIVVAGLALDRLRKRREGYVPAPTSMYDRGNGMQRIPPHELLEGLGTGRGVVPHV